MSFDDSFLGFGSRKSSRKSPTKKRSKRKGGGRKSIFGGDFGGLGKGLGGNLGGDFGGGLGGLKVGKTNGGQRKNLAKDAASGFESPGIFEGLKRNGGGLSERNDAGLERVERNGGLPVPQLGEDFNTRFGQIGTGFVERVDPFKIGFSDILTGNGRTGEIIKSRSGLEGESFDAFSKRKRGRPKGSGKVGRPKGSTKKSSGGLEFDSSELKKTVSSLAKEEGVSKKTARQILKERGGIGTGSVGSMLRESTSEGVGSIRERFRSRPGRSEASAFQREEFDDDEGVGGSLEREGDVDREQVDRFRVGLAVEQEVESEKEELLDDVEEDDPGMDEDMENGGDSNFKFEVKEGEIRRRNGE